MPTANVTHVNFCLHVSLVANPIAYKKSYCKNWNSCILTPLSMMTSPALFGIWASPLKIVTQRYCSAIIILWTNRVESDSRLMVAKLLVDFSIVYLFWYCLFQKWYAAKWKAHGVVYTSLFTSLTSLTSGIFGPRPRNAGIRTNLTPIPREKLTMKGFTLLFLTMTAKKGCAVVSATADETVG